MLYLPFQSITYRVVYNYVPRPASTFVLHVSQKNADGQKTHVLSAKLKDLTTWAMGVSQILDSTQNLYITFHSEHWMRKFSTVRLGQHRIEAYRIGAWMSVSKSHGPKCQPYPGRMNRVQVNGLDQEEIGEPHKVEDDVPIEAM